MRPSAVLTLTLLASMTPAAAVADESSELPQGLSASAEVTEGGELLLAGTLENGGSSRNRDLLFARGFGSPFRTLLSAPAGMEILEPSPGTDRRGRTAVVFSRCLIRPPSNRKCDVFRERQGRAVRLSASSRACDEGDPRMVRGILIFWRSSALGLARCRPGLYFKRPGRPVRRLSVGGSVADFDGERIALARTTLRRDSGTRDTDRTITEIVVVRPGRPGVRVLARGEATDYRGQGEGTAVGSPRLDGRAVLWVRERFDGFERDTSVKDVVRRSLDGGPATVLEREGRLYAQPPTDFLYGVEAGPPGSLFYFYADAISGAGMIGRVTPEPREFR